MNKPDLALNNIQWLICHKTKQYLKPFTFTQKNDLRLVYECYQLNVFINNIFNIYS